jgi:prophage DNA circulation protein
VSGFIGLANNIGGKLLPGRFRGAVFYAESAGGTNGYRYVDHVYPDRDIPYAEPLGRAQRTWSITAYVIGPGFRFLRDALVRACERKGPGTLFHPAIGVVQAVCRSVQWNEARDAGNYCTFTLEFAEPGELLQPSGFPDTAQLLEIAADALGVAAETAFVAKFNVEDALSYVGDFAATDVQATSVALERMRKPEYGADQSEVSEALESLYDDAYGLVHQPPELCTRTASCFEHFSDASDAHAAGLSMLTFATEYNSGSDYVDVVAPISPFAAGGSRASSNPADNVTPPPPVPPGTEYPSRVWLLRNQGSWQRFAREQALREFGYLCPALRITSQTQADEVLEAMTAAFDNAETAAADAGEDDVYIALIDLRGACMQDIYARRSTLAPMVDYRLPRSTNAIVMAWRFYQDCNRDLEIVAETNTYTPAFPPMRGTIRAS